MTPLQNARCCTAGAPHLLSLGTGSPPGCAAVGKGGRATAVGGQRLGAPPRCCCCCCSIGLLSHDRGLGGKHLPLPLLPPCARSPLQTVLLVVQAGFDVRETKCISRALQGYSSRGAVCQDAERNREKENAACEVVGRGLETTPNDFRLARRAFRSPELMLTRGPGEAAGGSPVPRTSVELGGRPPRRGVPLAQGCSLCVSPQDGRAGTRPLQELEPTAPGQPPRGFPAHPPPAGSPHPGEGPAAPRR